LDGKKKPRYGLKKLKTPFKSPDKKKQVLMREGRHVPPLTLRRATTKKLGKASEKESKRRRREG